MQGVLFFFQTFSGRYFINDHDWKTLQHIVTALSLFSVFVNIKLLIYNNTNLQGFSWHFISLWEIILKSVKVVIACPIC